MTLAVLVPVLNRPQNVVPLVESFRSSGTPGQLWFISTIDDDAENVAIETLDENVRRNIRAAILDGVEALKTSWPEKINKGIQIVEYHERVDWYLCAADDIRFTPGWWEATKGLRDDPTISVIGTNDSSDGSGNPRVARGEHTCHPLVRSDYIRTQGVIGRPGLAVWPGYHHWYVDDELVHTAKARHAWAYCKEAVIEHLHPYWRPQEVTWDDTYTLGQKNAAEDKTLFESRIPLIQAEYDKYR